MYSLLLSNFKFQQFLSLNLCLTLSMFTNLSLVDCDVVLAGLWILAGIVYICSFIYFVHHLMMVGVIL